MNIGKRARCGSLAIIVFVLPACMHTTRLVAQSALQPATGLKPGDHIRVNIWREPDLSGEFAVPPNGVIKFAKIGEVSVGQLSPDSVKSLLIARYAASLRDPVIELTPLRRIGVHGSVREPGFYYADPTITVAGAVLLAKGVTAEGNNQRIDVLRNGIQLHLAQKEGVFRDDSPVQSGDEIIVPQRSWASRNAALLASAITGVALVIATVVR